MPAFTPKAIISLAVEVDKGVAPIELVRSFTRLVEEMALQNAYSDKDERLEQAPHAGYLLTSSGPWKVYVPWHLAMGFPAPTVLDDLVVVAEGCMLDGKGNVALSGSTVFTGSLTALGDIDFAQYVFDDDENFSTRVRRLTERKGSSILVRAKVAEEYFSPWDDLIAVFTAWKNLADETTRVKFDFIDAATPFGLMPISNIILPSDASDHSKASARESFVFQEAVLVKDGDPPWSLVMSDELLRYLKFLVRETRHYREIRKTFKALKRALSLSRIIGLDELADRAEAALSQEGSNLTSHVSCIEELEKLWPHLSEEGRNQFNPELIEKKRMQEKINLQNSLLDAYAPIVDEVLKHVEQLLSEESVSIEDWARK